VGSPSPEGGSCHCRKNGVEKQLPLDQTGKFSVFVREKITLAVGDRIRFTKNVKHRVQKSSIARSGPCSALMMTRSYSIKARLFAMGPNASQAKTVDQVIVSVPVRAFSQANEAQFYVSMSRARLAMHVQLND
jgi:hypothetical protein